MVTIYRLLLTKLEKIKLIKLEILKILRTEFQNFFRSLSLLNFEFISSGQILCTDYKSASKHNKQYPVSANLVNPKGVLFKENYVSVIILLFSILK
jgi:hypothetical protein